MYYGLTEFTPAHAKILQQHAIDDRQPGTILADFNTLLDFIGPKGIPATAGHLFPLKILKPLNQRLSRPIELGLKRPQQKSYPHLNGLYLLLRSTALGRIDATDKQPRLMLDREVLQSWAGLNQTEQYFTLLETWALRANAGLIGEHTGGFFREFQLQNALRFFDWLPPEGRQIAGNADALDKLRYTPGLHNLALLELFGLIKVVPSPPVAGDGWQIGRIDRLPFGEALITLLGNHIKANYDEFFLDYNDTSEIPFGVLQPVLQPYFPAWQHNLTFPDQGFQAGVFIFKVSLGNIWRRIAIPAELTLDVLSSSILNAYQFDHDHLDRFTYTNRFGVSKQIHHPYMEEPPRTDEVKVGDLPIAPGTTIEYLFDFGDCWEFEVTLERIDPEDLTLSQPKLLEQHGRSPQQYGYWE